MSKTPYDCIPSEMCRERCLGDQLHSDATTSPVHGTDDDDDDKDGDDDGNVFVVVVRRVISESMFKVKSVDP